MSGRSKSGKRGPGHLRLGVNIDHVATIRNARGGRHPDPLRAAHLAVEAGADGITAHLREDRRHISDADIARLKRELTRPLNLEMAATDEMLAIALRHIPHACCLVPEKREEKHHRGRARRGARREPPAPLSSTTLKSAGIRVSLFIEPDAKADRGRGAARRRRSSSCTPAPIASARSRTTPRAWRGELDRLAARGAAAARGGPRGARRPRPHLQHRRRRRRASPRSSSSTSATSWSARRSSAGSARPSRACARSWTRPARGRRRRPARRGRRMILGLGNDIIDIRRIEKTIERFGDRFLAACLHRHGAQEIGRPRRPRRLLRQALRRQGGLRQGARNGVQEGRVLARHGRGQPALRPADDGADGRRRRAAAGASRPRASRPASTSR